MVLQAGCPRCTAPLVSSSGGCPVHGPVAPLWRPQHATYDDFGELLARAQRAAPRGFPTYLPWPLGPGWAVTDFGLVLDDEGVSASVTCSSGASELDGPVDVFVVTEEAGVGLGSRCAQIVHSDPGADIGDGPAAARVRVDSQSVPLWAVSTSAADDRFDRSVFVGEAAGRWLWLVLRPASAMLLLREGWILRDVSAAGPEVLEVAFGGSGPPLW